MLSVDPPSLTNTRAVFPRHDRRFSDIDLARDLVGASLVPDALRFSFVEARSRDASVGSRTRDVSFRISARA